jgi:hypothetical protein
VKGTVCLVFASMLLLVGCYTGPSADHFVAIVDELHVPAGWQVAETVVRGPDQPDYCDPGLSNECPAAIRFFVTEGDIDAAYDQAKGFASVAGFTISDEGTKGCASGSSNGPPCAFFAERGDDMLHVRVYASPNEAGLDQGKLGGAAVVVRATAAK